MFIVSTEDQIEKAVGIKRGNSLILLQYNNS
jgi:hypothetical protein